MVRAGPARLARSAPTARLLATCEKRDASSAAPGHPGLGLSCPASGQPQLLKSVNEREIGLNGCDGFAALLDPARMHVAQSGGLPQILHLFRIDPHNAA